MNLDRRNPYRESGDELQAFGPGCGWVRPAPGNQTQQQSPYAYSEFFLFRDDKVQPSNGASLSAVCAPGISADYSDRLAQRDISAWKRGLAASPNRLENWDCEAVTAFLMAYFGKPKKAHAMAQGCNPGNGYTYWIFWHSDDVAEG